MLIYRVVLDKKVILIGYSGHAFVVVEAVLENGLEIIGYSDKEPSDINPYNLSYLGFEKDDDFREGDTLSVYWNPERAVAIKAVK